MRMVTKAKMIGSIPGKFYFHEAQTEKPDITVRNKFGCQDVTMHSRSILVK